MIFRKLLIFKVTHILVNISQGPLRISPKFQVQSSRGKLCILAPTTKMGRILTEKSKLGGSVGTHQVSGYEAVQGQYQI